MESSVDTKCSTEPARETAPLPFRFTKTTPLSGGAGLSVRIKAYQEWSPTSAQLTAFDKVCLTLTNSPQQLQSGISNLCASCSCYEK